MSTTDILFDTAIGIIFKGRPNWDQCRIYDLNNLPLTETTSSRISIFGREIEFMVGCVGRKLSPISRFIP